MTTDKRKNVQFRQGNKVLVASSPLATVCRVRLLRELQISTGGSADMHVFRGFNGIPVPRARALQRRARRRSPRIRSFAF